MKSFAGIGALAFALVAGGLLLGTNQLAAQDVDPHPDAEYRQNLMTSIKGHVGAAEAIVNGDVGHQAALMGHAEALNAISASLTHAFPAGSGGEGSRALDEVWSMSSDFSARLQSFATATQGFLASVQSGDADAVPSAFGELRQTCRGCHSDFRAR